jgi:hypothetical protein
MIVSNKLEIMCKEMIVEYFKVLSQNFPGGKDVLRKQHGL